MLVTSTYLTQFYPNAIAIAFFFFQLLSHRNTEYPKFEKTNKEHQIQLTALHTITQKSEHVSESIAQILLELQKAWGQDQCPEEPVPVPELT